MSELPCSMIIENKNISIEVLNNTHGIFGQYNIFEVHRTLNSAEVGNGLVPMTGGYTIALIWSNSDFFLFDSHSRDQNGGFTAEGATVLLSFKTLSDVQQYIKNEYAKHIPRFDETQFELQYIKVISADSPGILESIKKSRHRNLSNKSYNKQIKRKKCTVPTNRTTLSSSEKVSKFIEVVKQGPYYICVVCNRYLYQKSVIIFKPKIYPIDIIDFYREVNSCDGRLYICHTFHKKL